MKFMKILSHKRRASTVYILYIYYGWGNTFTILFIILKVNNDLFILEMIIHEYSINGTSLFYNVSIVLLEYTNIFNDDLHVAFKS